MSFIYVAHVKEDKPKLRTILDQLITAGHKIWLDNPRHEALGYSAEFIRDHIYQLEDGVSWRSDMKQALYDASCILVCFSEELTSEEVDHKVFRKELDFADTSKKLVTCRLDDVDPDKLKRRYGEHQMYNILDKETGEKSRELLIRRIQKIMKDHQYNNSKRRNPSNIHHVYLIDRHEQQYTIDETLKEVDGNGGNVQPFILGAPINECLDEFIDRICWYNDVTPKRDSEIWKKIYIQWPDQSKPMQFEKSYRYQLVSKMELSDSNNDAICSSLRESAPLAIISRMDAQDWNKQTLNDWIKFWSNISRIVNDFQIYPILGIDMPIPKRNWHEKERECPDLWAGKIRTLAMWNEIKSLCSEDVNDLKSKIIPILPTIRRRRVKDWLNDVIGDSFDTEQVKVLGENVEKIYEKKRWFRKPLDLRYLPHEDIAQGLKPVIDGQPFNGGKK